MLTWYLLNMGRSDSEYNYLADSFYQYSDEKVSEIVNLYYKDSLSRIDFYARASNIFMGDYFDNAPEDLVIRKSKRETLLLIGDDKSTISLLIKIFPFSHYKIVSWISDTISKMYVENVNVEQVITNVDKILICDYEKQEKISNYLFEKYTTSKDKIIVYEKIIHPEYNEVYKFKFGPLNSKKFFFVMTPTSSNGLLWLLIRFSTMYSGMENTISYVDMRNYSNMYMPPIEIGWYNLWEYYFKQLSDYTLDEIYDSENVILCNAAGAHSEKKMLNKYDKSWLSNRILKKEEKTYTEIYGNRKRVLGVFLRGTDYNTTPWHKIPFDPFEAIEKAKEYMEHYHLKYVFLDTEDTNNYDVFKNYFKDKLISLNRERYGIENDLCHDMYKAKRFNGVIVGENYIIETLLVSRADIIITSMGSSEDVIKRFHEEKTILFKNILTKNKRGSAGRYPIVVESHNKNYLNLKNKENEFCKGGVLFEYFKDGRLHIFGKSIEQIKTNISVCQPIFLKAQKQYCCSVTGLEKYDSVDIEFHFVDIEKNTKIISYRSDFIFNVETYSVETIIKIEPNTTIDSIISIQVEEGAFPTDYESFRFSETEVGVIDCLNLYYKPQYVNSIDFNTGEMDISGNKTYMLPSELNMYWKIIRYSRGFLLYKYNNKYYDSLLKINDSQLAIKNCVDWEWIEDLVNNYLSRQIIYSIIESLYKTNDIDYNTKSYELATKIKNKDATIKRRISLMYLNGKGVEKDLDKAADWMRKASQRLGGWSYNELFDILWKINTSESLSEMISVAQNAAEKGDGHAMLRLGRAYREGMGVEKDLDKAADWMRKAIQKNTIQAKIELTQIHNNS